MSPTTPDGEEPVEREVSAANRRCPKVRFTGAPHCIRGGVLAALKQYATRRLPETLP